MTIFLGLCPMKGRFRFSFACDFSCGEPPRYALRFPPIPMRLLTQWIQWLLGRNILRIPNIESELCFPQSKVAKKHFFFPICFWSKVWNQPIFFSPRKFSGGKKTVEISFRFCVKGHSTRIFQCYAGGDWREGAMMRRACRRFFFEIWQGNVVSLPDIWRCNHWRFTLNICKFHQASKITRFFYFLVSFYKNRVAPKKARLGSFAGSLCWCCCQWNPEIHEDVETDACGWPFWRPGNMNPRCWVFTRSNLMAGTIQQLIWHVPWDMQAWPSRTLSFSHLGQQIH